MGTDGINLELLRQLLTDAVSQLNPNDVAIRMANIQQGRAPAGVVSHRDDEYLAFDWGGLPLCQIFAADLERTDVTADMFEVHDAEVPDILPPDWAED